MRARKHSRAAAAEDRGTLLATIVFAKHVAAKILDAHRLQRRRITPAVMKHARAAIGFDQAARPIAAAPHEATRIAGGFDPFNALHRSNRAWIKPQPVVGDVLIVAPEVQIVEQQAFGAAVVMIDQRLFQRRQIIFMQHFVGLQIDRPVTSAPRQREIGLLRQHGSADAWQSPGRSKRTQALIVDRGDRLPRAIVIVADGDDQFIDQRQQRAQRRLEGVPQADRRSQNREAADLHGVHLIMRGIPP